MSATELTGPLSNASSSVDVAAGLAQARRRVARRALPLHEAGE